MPQVNVSGPQELGNGRVWITDSSSRPGVRHVTLFDESKGWICTCEGMRFRRHCKHVDQLKEETDDFEVSL